MKSQEDTNGERSTARQVTAAALPAPKNCSRMEEGGAEGPEPQDTSTDDKTSRYVAEASDQPARGRGEREKLKNNKR